MKLARVFIEEYPGRQIGDILDVIDSDNHPGHVREGIILEVPVADDFDSSVVSGEVRTERWTKEGEETVFVDPADPSYTHETGKFVEFVADQDKADAVDLADKKAQVAALYDTLNQEIEDKLVEVFGTKRADSATAFEKQWNLMSSNPSAWSGQNLVARVASATYAKGDALDTDMKVETYANEKLAEVEAAAIWRADKIQTFDSDSATIMGS